MNIKRAFVLVLAGLLLPAGALMAQTQEDAFTVKTTKVFSNGSDYEVDVTLTCNTGLPLEQTFTIAGGDPEGVTFVVTDFADGTMSCEVTEVGSPDGYSVVMNDGEGCAWDNIELGQSEECVIENWADDASYTVSKEWVVVRDGGDAVEENAYVVVYCDNEIAGGTWNEGGGYWSKGAWLYGDDDMTVSVDVSEDNANCYAQETQLNSGVEVTSSGCGSAELGPGGSHTCSFTNTVFFEGIPTLSQYGLAVLALLVLGVGFIGFRRFI